MTLAVAEPETVIIDAAIDDALRAFDSRIERQSGCWLWTAGTGHNPKYPNGKYGLLWCGGRMVYAHRFSYECFVGPIPDGYVIDHLCRNTLCVFPPHLEAVPFITNVQRGSGQRHPVRVEAANRYCKHGHWLDADNTYWNPQGFPSCRRCQAERARLARDGEPPQPEREQEEKAVQ